MKKNAIHELRIRLPVIMVGLLLTGAAGTKMALGYEFVPSLSTKIEQPAKDKNAELRERLSEVSPYASNDMHVIPKGMPASMIVLDIPEAKPQRQDMIFGGSRAWFQGVQGDDTYTDNFSLAQKLRVLWSYKMKVPGVKPAVSKSMEVILGEFEHGQKTKMNLKAFVDRANKLVKDTHKALDYERFCARMNMADSECDLLEDVTDDLRGKDMVAYGMTELLPSLDGNRNISILDGVLQHAGIEYLNSVPAFGDPLLSKGLYQFTSYAVRHDANSAEGASIVNAFVKRESQIPGSVVKLSSDDQHRAAFLFTTFNVARWIKRMSKEEMKTFKKLMPKRQGELIQYIAVSHHMPARTIQYANAWLDRKGKDSFLAFLPPHLKAYGTKTKMNYEALVNYMD